MKIRLAVQGRIGQGGEAELVERYLKRVPWDVKTSEVSSTAAIQWPERGTGRTILLDERGDILSSEDFARVLGGWRDAGVRDMLFAIGGADGFSDADRQRADLLLSFGRMTWPHLMARAMLAEQLWRAASILSGHPYHRAG
jgi:23S rRNA (pseudouridine1915-N3)-methyltransferase